MQLVIHILQCRFSYGCTRADGTGSGAVNCLTCSVELWRWPREKATVVLLSCLLGSHPTRSRIIWGLRTGCKPATSVVCLLKALPHSDPPAVPAAAQALSSAVLRSWLYRVYRPMKAKSTLGPFRFQRDAKASPYSAQIVPG